MIFLNENCPLKYDPNNDYMMKHFSSACLRTTYKLQMEDDKRFFPLEKVHFKSPLVATEVHCLAPASLEIAAMEILSFVRWPV